LQRLTRSFRSGNNFTEVQVDLNAEGSGALWINDDLGHPNFVMGLLERGLHRTGGTSFAMRLTKQEGSSATFEIHL
jgi:uncharacterized protein (TIGR02265 family)